MVTGNVWWDDRRYTLRGIEDCSPTVLESVDMLVALAGVTGW